MTAGTAGSAGTADLSSGLVVAADTAADNETFVLGLARRVREAQEAATRRQERSDHLASARAQQAEARQRLGTLEDEQQSWMRRAGVASEADLERAAGEARRHAGLVTERDRARALLEAALGYGGPPSNETFHDMALSTLAPAAGKAGVGGEDAADTHLLRAALDGLRDASAESLEGERQALLAELEAQRDALGEAQIEVGKLREDLERRGDEQQAALHAALAEEERAALREDVEEYVVRFFAARVLQGVIESYARDNQPALLRTASSLIQRITDGQYGAVRQSRDEKSLVLVPADGGPARLPERLSTGEREQMFLALRLAFVTHYCASAEPLPVVLDDVLVNFDERRAAATLRALADVSRTTQVLFFTCHRDLRDLAAQAVPDAASCDLSLREMGGSA